MTDETERNEVSRSNVSTADNCTAVPEDTEWELEIQVPFERGETNDLTSAIIVAVAETEGVSPVEIKEPPLYEVLDIAAIETAFFGSDTIGQSSNGHRSVEFMYRDHRVVIRSDAWVQVFTAKEA